jgi:tricorn protease interacting factor F2/3
VKAEEYQLTLDVDFQQLTFRGTVRLTGDWDGPAVRLNAVGLEIRGARSGIVPLTVSSLEESQEIQLDGLPVGAREIELDFAGKALDQTLLGLYRSYQPPDYILATQFESTGARRVFPCLDRPDQKATFDVEVTLDAGLTVIFNTPAAESSLADGRQRIHFEKTPRMSTYLVFLAIGKFDALRGHGPGTPVAVWTPPGVAEQGRFALSVAQRVLAEFERYYDVPYPLAKLDLVSVRDFGAGAMENWGAIASRERLLLVDDRTSAGQRRAIATVTAHEIAHQWFGDLVTMQWWDEVWLNESFAALMAYKVLDRLGDTPGIWSDFLLVEMGGALLGDSLTSTHPIRQAVDSPEEIDQIFDEISYGKGASVLRMLEGFVGAEAFRRGVHEYLVTHQYQNARGEDLWAALGAAARQPVSDLMRRWVERPGHPVLIVHRGPDGIHLEQRRFSLSGEHQRQYWPVPLVARTNGTAVRMLMAGPDVTLQVPSDSDVLLNEGALGFYRVLYDDPTYEQLLGRFERLDAPERWLILEDLFAFMLSGDVAFDRWKGFAEKTVHEIDPLVVHGAMNQLQQLTLCLHDDPAFVDLYRRFHAAQTDRLGLTPRPADTDMDRRLRDFALRSRILLDPDFAAELASKFSEFDQLHPDLRQAVLMSYAQVRGSAAVEDLWKRVREGNDAAQQQVARAFGALEEPKVLTETLDREGRGEMPFSQMFYTLLEAGWHARSRPAIWEWFVRNRDGFVGGLAGTSTLSLIMEELTLYEGVDHPREAREYFAQHPVAGAERGVRKGLEYGDLYARLRARHRAEASPRRPT